MGSCGTKLQNEICYKPTRSNIEKQSITFTKPEIIKIYSDNTDANINHPFLCESIQDEALIKLRFMGTTFYEDITYEYEMSCNLQNTPKWKLKLTVEDLTKFYAEILIKYPSNKISIPYQFGKVMHPNVFTSLLDNILQTSILKDKKLFFSETTANFFNIPCEIRSVLQYNAEVFNHYENMNGDAFKYSELISANDDKYKYLCHSAYICTDDCECGNYQCYDEPQVMCYSYWVRSLKYNVDFLLNVSNNIFYIVMSDLSYNISQILMNNIGLDERCAWIITDYLPKYLLFNHKDEKCNAQFVYKYNNDCASFLLQHSNNKLLERHNINADELYNMCERLCLQHINVEYTQSELLRNESVYNSTIQKSKPDDAGAISLEIDELVVEDKYVTHNHECVYVIDYDNNNEKSEIMQTNNYDLSPSTSTNTIVDIEQNKSFSELCT
eukprot:123568_1